MAQDATGYSPQADARTHLDSCNRLAVLALLEIVEKGMRPFGWVESILTGAKDVAPAGLHPFSLVFCRLSRHQNGIWMCLRSLQMLKREISAMLDVLRRRTFDWLDPHRR